MYTIENGKLYKINKEEINLVNLKDFNNNTSKLELEGKDLGAPTCDIIEINPEEAKEDVPQAWKNNGKWYYNWRGAIMESANLGKRMPTRDEWGILCKGMERGEELVKRYGLDYNSYRDWSEGHYYKSSDAYYWSSTPYSTFSYNLYFDSTNLRPTLYGNRANGFSVRCLK